MDTKMSKSQDIVSRVAAIISATLVISTIFAATPSYASPPAPGEIVAVTDSSGDLIDHTGADTPAISEDGTLVAFVSSSDALPHANGHAQVYLKDLNTGEIRSLSVGYDDAPANAEVRNPVLSADGRFVVFVSAATNLVDGYDTHGVSHVYRRAVTEGSVIEPVSVGSTTDVRGAPDVSENGDYVVFSTAHPLTGDRRSPGVDQVYLRVMSFGSTLQLSHRGGIPANGHSMAATISPNGRYVAFLSSASNLLGYDSGIVQAWQFDLYNYWAGPRLVSVSSDGTIGNRNTVRADVADTGAVVFESLATNLSDVTSRVRQSRIYVTDGPGETVHLVSRAAADGGDVRGSSEHPMISRDGSVVAYLSSGEGLTVDDAPRVQLYTWDAATDTNVLRSRNRAGQPGDGATGTLCLSAGGEYAAYLTESRNLVPLPVDPKGWQLLVQSFS